MVNQYLTWRKANTVFKTVFGYWNIKHFIIQNSYPYKIRENYNRGVNAALIHIFQFNLMKTAYKLGDTKN